MGRKKYHRHKVALRRSHARYRWRSLAQAVWTAATRLFGVALALWLAVLTYAFWRHSPWLEVRGVEVTGPAPADFLSRLGLSEGDRLFGFAAARTERRLAVEFPGLALVRVRRGWDRVVRVDVRARRPAVKVHDGGQWLAMDREGALFPLPADAAPGRRLLILAGAGQGPAALPALEFTRRIEGLPSAWAQRVYKVKLQPDGEAVLYLEGDIPVQWGPLPAAEEDFLAKARRLERVWDDPALAGGAAYVRFVDDRRIAVKPK